MNERAVSNAWVGGGCRGRCGPAQPPHQGCVGTGSPRDSPQHLPLLMGGSPPALLGDRALEQGWGLPSPCRWLWPPPCRAGMQQRWPWAALLPGPAL